MDMPELLYGEDNELHLPVDPTPEDIKALGSTSPRENATATEQNVYETGYKLARAMINNKELTSEVRHDDLTGLLTKKAMLEIANRRFLEASPGTVFAVLFIDLDNFKAINELHPDKYEAGDQAIRDIGELLRKDTRQEERFYDLLARGDRKDTDASRLGGDEFAVIVELTSRDGSNKNLTPEERLAALYTRLQTDFQAYLQGRPDLQKLRYGMSIGTALRQPNETAEEMLSRASHAIEIEKVLHRSQNGSYR